SFASNRHSIRRPLRSSRLSRHTTPCSVKRRRRAGDIGADASASIAGSKKRSTKTTFTRLLPRRGEKGVRALFPVKGSEKGVRALFRHPRKRALTPYRKKGPDPFFALSGHPAARSVVPSR